MNNRDYFLKKLLFRSTHRGTKEMDLFLGSFLKDPSFVTFTFFLSILTLVIGARFETLCSSEWVTAYSATKDLF